MRLLFVPACNSPMRLGSDSIYIISSEWCRALCEQNEDVFVYRILPVAGLKDTYKRYSYDYEPVHERVHDIFVEQYSWYMMEEANASFDFYRQFHPIMGDYPVDAVVCTSASKMVHIKAILSAGTPFPMQGFFNFELLIRGLGGSNEVAHVAEHEMVLQSCGEVFGVNLFQSPICRDIASRVSAKYFPASMVRRLISNSSVVYSGYDDSVAYDVGLSNRYDRFTVVVRGRVTASKNLDRVLGLCNKFCAAGNELRIVITTGDDRARDRLAVQLAENRSIEYQYCKSKGESMDVMRRSHVFVLWSTHELFCVSAWECLGSGVIGIFKKSRWLDGLLPDGYPYVFESEVEAYAMLADLYANYEKRYEELGWVFSYVKETYSYRNTVQCALDVIRRSCPELRPRDWLVSMIEGFNLSSVGIDELEKLISKRVKPGNIVFARKSHAYRVQHAVGRLELMATACKAGCRDDVSGPIPTVVKC